MNIKIYYDDEYLKLNKENIAFIFCTNDIENVESEICEEICETLRKGNWLKDHFFEKNKVYLSNNNILNLDELNKYTTTIYIMKDQIIKDYDNTELYKIYDLGSNVDYYKVLGYFLHTVNSEGEVCKKSTGKVLCAYSFVEKKFNKDVKFLKNVDNDDIGNLLDTNYFAKLDELFIAERYKRSLLDSVSRYLSGINKKIKEVWVDSGFETAIIKYNEKENNFVIKVNEYYKTNIDEKDFLKIDINNSLNAFINCYSICDNWISNNTQIILKEYINKIENKLGNFISFYKINDEGYKPRINVSTVSMGTWCLVYEKAVVIISYGIYD